MTLPFSYVSDRYDRRLVLSLNSLGIALMYSWMVFTARLPGVIPITTMLVGPFFTLLGGGDCVLLSTVAAVVTEISSDQLQR